MLRAGRRDALEVALGQPLSRDRLVVERDELALRGAGEHEAARGGHHWRVAKDVTDGETLSRVLPLSDAARVDEIARMLGGVKITEQTLAHAREMLES